MTQLIIIAHAPLASALAAVGRHAFPEQSRSLLAIDVMPDDDMDALEGQLRERLACVEEALLIADVFGATPGNVAARVVDGARARLVYGANVPLLWRVLNYLGKRSLPDLADLAVAGAVQGVMMVAGGTRPQNQTSLKSHHDPDNSQDQQ